MKHLVFIVVLVSFVMGCSSFLPSSDLEKAKWCAELRLEIQRESKLLGRQNPLVIPQIRNAFWVPFAPFLSGILASIIGGAIVVELEQIDEEKRRIENFDAIVDLYMSECEPLAT
ncbi:MAG: hypothetical protein OXF31_09550 [Gammaproteobacteria bacterium]|nr:hypothetical protein [Gammaproteobacteria bacterium]